MGHVHVVWFIPRFRFHVSVIPESILDRSIYFRKLTTIFYARYHLYTYICILYRCYKAVLLVFLPVCQPYSVYQQIQLQVRLLITVNRQRG